MDISKNIVVIGGGPSGIEAATQLAALGFTPFLLEKESELGGHLLKWDRLFPEGVYAKDVLKDMLANIDKVKWLVNTEIISINKLKESFNVKLSTGVSILADAVLFTTGFNQFPAEKKEEYGYGIYDKVITNEELEWFFKTGSDKRINNPQRIGFVHCVGSRDEKVGNRYCSKVCCATAVKQASEMKEMFPKAQVYSFYMDLRMFGRGYEDLYLEAQRDWGVRFIRGRVSEVSENGAGEIVVKAEDTLSGKPVKVTLDLLVLMSGMVNKPETSKLAGFLSIPTQEDGFLKSKDSILNIHKSSRDGVFFAGACTGPKTLPESLAEARSAALDIYRYVAGKTSKVSNNE